MSAAAQRQRTLAVLLHADIAQSTALVQRNETLAHDRINDAFQRLSTCISTYDGTVHEIRGDALVAEFNRASDAVSAALAFQKSQTTHLQELTDDVAPIMRIGISLGEVVIGNHTITGAGIVLAQRVEQLSSPGGVCITAAIHEALPRHLPFHQRDLGERKIKGFDEPVRVYAVGLRAGAELERPSTASRLRKSPAQSRAVTIAAILSLSMVLGLLAWWRPWASIAEPASDSRLPTNSPERPSIAVLPFLNLSADPNQEYFSDGVTEDLTTDLSKLPGLFVVSRNSAFVFKGKPVQSKDIADQLGVQYLLEGSVRRSSTNVRINVQLIDAATGGHMWANRYDGPLTNVFAAQDEVVAQVAYALSLEIVDEGTNEILGNGTTSVAAHDAYLLGLAAYYRRTPEANAAARAHFERALEADPEFTDTYTSLAKVYLRAAILEQSYADTLEIYWADGYTRAWRLLAKVKGQPNADYYVLRSWLNLNKHQHRIAIQDAKRALSLNPNDADALEALAAALVFSGDYEQGILTAEQAIRQNPSLMGYPLYLIGVAEFARNNVRESIRRIEQAKRSAASERAAFSGVLAAALGELGDLAEARGAFEQYARKYVNRPARAWSTRAPDFANPRFHGFRRIDLAWSAYAFPFSDAEVLRRFASGLELAGATVGLGRYLPLYETNRLDGSEVQSVLFDHTIQGQDFWLSRFHWQQSRSATGFVEHAGFDIHAGLPASATGQGNIKGDALCETWPVISRNMEICVAVFRVSDSDAQARWGEYVMVTDTGPHPFSVSR